MGMNSHSFLGKVARNEDGVDESIPVGKPGSGNLCSPDFRV